MRELITIQPDGSKTVEHHNNVTLKMLQERVGGYIEAVRPSTRYEGRPAEIWADEEGLLKGLERNGVAQNLLGVALVGPVVINRVYKP